mgnify:CR=1 FL=1
MRLAVTTAFFAFLAAEVAACGALPQPPAALRGSLVSNQDNTADITRAYFDGPTRIYDHGVLGDAIEATHLRVVGPVDTASCGVEIAAGEGHVFEDTAPRLTDLDSDGRSEVIVVRTSLTQGAQMAIYGMKDGALALLATTPYIGQAHRWLAPIGAGDIDGDGRIEVAYIDRPHLARVMRVWRFDGARLTEAYQIAGLTNHRIGDTTISGGFRTCDGVTEAVTASADWSRLLATRISSGKALMRDLGPNTGADAFAAALDCQR